MGAVIYHLEEAGLIGQNVGEVTGNGKEHRNE